MSMVGIAAWGSLCGVVLATAFGHFFYKLYFLRRRVSLVVAAMSTFLLAPVFSYLALHSLGIGLVYMSTAMSLVVVILLSRFALNERISGRQVIAMLLIVGGVACYGQGV